ncbi:hypothetical protein PVAP13_8KG214100 [Panicum virgatum]|uniref:Uncharacterized protein n=1 Tax=Panicum virgatum TaxID=38727 RepID=A0A8T0PIJ5_PANVG|nr:hypothetical protein PVAP13_8KG214100 [Panicum virgatum]
MAATAIPWGAIGGGLGAYFGPSVLDRAFDFIVGTAAAVADLTARGINGIIEAIPPSAPQVDTDDLQRQLVTSRERTAELQRQLVKSRERTAELQRQLVKSREKTAELQRQLVKSREITAELQRELDECMTAKPKLKVEFELKVKLIMELELKINLQLEIEGTIRLELEECKVRKDELQRELEECREEKVKLQLKLEVCKVKKGELQRQLEDTRKAMWVLAKEIVAATKAYDAEKAKMMKELEELKSKQLGK